MDDYAALCFAPALVIFTLIGVGDVRITKIRRRISKRPLLPENPTPLEKRKAL